MPRKKRSQASNPKVDEMTQGLGIDPEAGPEQAAADEGAKAAAAEQERLDRAAQQGAGAQAEADGLDLTDAQEQPPAAGPEETQPEQPAEPEEEAPAAPVIELSPRMLQQLTPQQTPEPRQSKKQRAEEAQAAKVALKTQSPSTKRLGPLSAKVPGAEHIKIHKRAEDGMPGKRSYVGDYDVYDLSQSQDLETFIARYIKPKWGAGEYQVTGVDAKGQEFDAGVIKLIDPLPEPAAPAQGTTVLDILQKTLEREQARKDRELELLRNRPREAPAAPPLNPVKQLGDIFDLSQRVGEGTKKEAEGTMAAMIQAMSQQTSAMMQLIMNQQAEGEKRMAAVLETLGKPKEMDPVLGAILAKIIEDKGGGNMPPPPPPPPPRNPVEELKTLAEAMQLMKGNDERLGIKDVLDLVRQNQQASGTDKFKEAMEHMSTLLQATQMIKQQTEGGGQNSGFWEFAQALASNRDLAGMLGDAVRSRAAMMQQAHGAPPQQRYRVLPPQAMAAEEEQLNQQIRNIQERRMLLAQRRLQAERQGLEQDLINDTARHRPVVVGDEPPKAPAQQPPASPPLADEQDMEAVQRTRARTGGKLPQFPPDIAEHINSMVLADDDGALVEGIIRMLAYLSELEDWQQFAELQMSYLRAGDKGNFLQFMGAFFDGLIKIQYMGEDLKDRALSVLEQHFDVISEKTRESEEEEEEGEGSEEGEEDLEEPQQ